MKIYQPIVLSAILFCSGSAIGQHLFVAPTHTEFDRIDFLTGLQGSSRFSIAGRAQYHFDTNVLDFAQAGIKHPKTQTIYNGGTAYYTSDRNLELEIARGQWALTYSMIAAELYRGNHDAAQLYLDSKSGTINKSGIYNPDMFLSRSNADRFRVSYTSPIHIGSHPALIQLAGSYIDLERAQLGTLQGMTVNGSLHGTLDLKTTAGLMAGQRDSRAASVDVGLSSALTPKFRVSLLAENLVSHVWQRTVQHITASVQTNTLVPDASGFLQLAPLFSGMVVNESLDSEVAPRYQVGASFSEKQHDWLALAAHDFDWRARLGVNLHLHRGGRFWILVTPDPFEWQFGYGIGGFQFQFGLSSVDIGTSQRATIQLGYRLVL